MINLMYIVLTAMLALSVSSDVLDGFGEESEKKMGVVKQQAIYAQAAISHPLSLISYFLSQ